MSIEHHTSESVTEGHPDKVCDAIAASILDRAITASSEVHSRPRVAMEVSAKGTDEGGTLMLFGEVTLPDGVTIPYADIARETLERIGYVDSSSGFHAGLTDLIIRISQQSSDISHGITRRRTGAGDQGVMFGGATAETKQLMPMPIAIAHALTNRYTYLYQNGAKWLRPDAKSQVTVRYENGVPIGIEKLVLSASHDPLLQLADLRHRINNDVIEPVIDEFGLKVFGSKRNILINRAGRWTIYGPMADAGTTNRKIIVDTYGGAFSHGGGGFNGKDPTKVDLSGAVGARYVAKALVAERLAKKVEIEVSYCIAQPDPLAINIETFGTATKPDKILKQRASQILTMSVDGIIEGLDLFQPFYAQAAAGGFFGREIFPWERIEN